MEKFQDLIEKIKENPKFLIGAGFFVILVTGWLWMASLGPGDKSINNEVSPSPVISVPISEVLDSPLVSPTGLYTEWISYVGSNFGLRHPQIWQEQPAYITTGGIALTLAPFDNPSDVFFPRFSVRVTPLWSEEALNQRIDQLNSVYKLNKTQTTFHGNPSVRLDGILDVTFVTGNPDQKKVHKTIMYVTLPNNSAEVEYAYFEDEDKNNNVSIINEMLDSLEFK